MSNQPVRRESAGKPRRIFQPLWPSFGIGGALFALSAYAIREPSVSPYNALVPPCLLAGLGIWTTVLLLIRLNRDGQRGGNVFRFVDDYLDRVRGFLFDNPEIAADARIRKALIPSREELALLRLHETRQRTFGEFREGTHWMVRGGFRTGPSLRLDLCLRPKDHETASVAVSRTSMPPCGEEGES